MDKREWEKIEEVVDGALDYAGENRKEYIKYKCADDQSLRQKVRKYMRAIEESQGFLED